MWFAWKYLPLWYQQQLSRFSTMIIWGCDLLENIYLCGINNNVSLFISSSLSLWFAWKYLPLWYQQQLMVLALYPLFSCDLLENIYLCGINNNTFLFFVSATIVVICLKISTFVVSTTTRRWKRLCQECCDLLKNIYLCGINNNSRRSTMPTRRVVICLKISTFVVSTTTTH